MVESKSLPSIGAIAFEALDEFTCLRTLDFSGCKNYGSLLKKLPNGIEKLIHLRYLNLAYNYALTELPQTVCDLCNLQSLIVIHCKGLKNLPAGLGKVINLRHLELASMGLSFLPKGFERLTSLHYLNLAYNYALKELPETVCDLCNLQSLNVTHCEDLKNLPRGLGKLIKLRRLETVSSSISFLPKGLERLTCLKTLNTFYVSDNSDASTIGDLKDLNHLRGCLKILELGKVRDVNEVKRAQLENKEHLVVLVLDFSGYGISGESNELIEAIQPPPNLEELSILHCNGHVLPNWMMSLTKLRKVRLYWYCELLPFLGKLLSLESLIIEHMHNVKRVGIEFLGIETKNESEATTSSLSVIAFPELKQLHFDHLLGWEEWDYGITTSSIIIMPTSALLSDQGLSTLKCIARPHILQSTSLQELEISKRLGWLSNLQERYYDYRKGKDWPKIAHIPNIKIDGKYVQKDGLLVPSQ